MRKRGPPSEVARLAAPLAGVLDAAWQRMHWWVTAMGILYLVSGITVVRSDEVAVVLRWGRLVGDTPALQEHGSGLLFALPRPVDEVVRVKVKHVGEVGIKTIAPSDADLSAPLYEEPPEEETEPGSQDAGTLDPLTEGYALTGDQNIVQADIVARYRVRDPAQWAFYGPKVEDVLRVEVTAAMVQSLGEMGVDRVLSDGRKTLIATAARRVQAGLDSARSGLELSSLELTRLTPPLAVAGEFSAVQSAFISAETRKKDALAFAESAVPRANAESDARLQAARAAADSELSLARGDSAAFRALDKEYRANPAVVRERLYRDGIEQALSAGILRWVPPPVDGAYHGFRIAIPANGTGSSGRGGPPAPRD